MLKLRNDKFLGKGCHKLTYLDPEDYKKCIKIIYNPDGMIDIKRELDYRTYRNRKGLNSTIIPAYYGTVDTDQGVGYVFEYICDYDGKASATLMDYVLDEKLLQRDYNDIKALMLELKEHLWKDKIISMNITPENIFFQQIAPGKLKLYLISDLGVAEFFPLVLYFDSLAYKKIQRHWDKLLHLLPQKWGSNPTLTRLATELKKA